jgi:hypothetical protein
MSGSGNVGGMGGLVHVGVYLLHSGGSHGAANWLGCTAQWSGCTAMYCTQWFGCTLRSLFQGVQAPSCCALRTDCVLCPMVRP